MAQKKNPPVLRGPLNPQCPTGLAIYQRNPEISGLYDACWKFNTNLLTSVTQLSTNFRPQSHAIHSFPFHPLRTNHVPCALPKMFRNFFTDVSFIHDVATSEENVELRFWKPYKLQFPILLVVTIIEVCTEKIYK